MFNTSSSLLRTVQIDSLSVGPNETVDNRETSFEFILHGVNSMVSNASI